MKNMKNDVQVDVWVRYPSPIFELPYWNRNLVFLVQKCVWLLNAGAFEIANYDLVSVFVEKLWKEIPAAKLLLFDTLHHIMEYAEIRRDVLATPAMRYFTSYLESKDLAIREGAARCVGDLAVEVFGKTQANGCGTVEILTDLLIKEPEDRPTMAPISYALMMWDSQLDIQKYFTWTRIIFETEPKKTFSKYDCIPIQSTSSTYSNVYLLNLL